MADFPGEEFAGSGLTEAPATSSPAEAFCAVGGGAIVYYHMYALDLNALPTVIYREWTVPNNPDFTAALYTGPYSGGSPTFGFIVVLNTFMQ